MITTMKTFSRNKDKRMHINNQLHTMATRLKKGDNDWLRSKLQVEDLSDILGSNHILIARSYDGMFNVHIANINELTDHIKKFALDRNLNLKDSRTLDRFIKETIILWT